MSGKYHLAYVFERFPSFTQTFCVREILELERQGLRPMLFSIRDTREEVPRNFPDELYERVHFLPPEKELVEEIKQRKADGELPQSIVLTLRHWKEKEDGRDKQRVYEAAWIGRKLREAGVRHAHSHFAGVGARTCWWLKFFDDITYGFTGHANDIFTETGLPLTLDRLIRDASLVATVSDYTVLDLESRFPHGAGKIKRVYNGLDLGPFLEAAKRRDAETVWGGERLVLSVGRLIEKKGFDDLIRSCAILRDRGEKDFRCVIVGDGPLEGELTALIDEWNVGELVELAGPKSQDEIIELLERTAVFALPCVTEKDGGKDNLPTVLMEAMAAKVACASTILAGVPEMVVDEVTGRIVPERQPEQFADAMLDLLSDPKRGEALGAAGAQRAKALFAKEVTARMLRRCLVGRGLVRFDSALVADDSGLMLCYLRQWLMRIGRLFRWRNGRRAG